MEFVSESEYITALILVPVFSLALFLILSFIEIFENHGEILFLKKIHTYTNKDLILPLIIAVLFGLLFYAFYFHLGAYLNSFPPIDPDPCIDDLDCRKNNESMTWFSLIDKYVKPLLNEWGFS